MSQFGSGDQRGIETAMAAGARERANKPRHVVMIAVVVLVIAGVYGLMSWSKLSGAKRELRGLNSQYASTKRLMNEIESIEQNQSGFEQTTYGVSIIEGLATSVGLEGTRVSEKTDEDRSLKPLGLRPKRYTTEVRNAEPEKLLQWLITVMSADELDGIDIDLLKLKQERSRTPDQGGWTMNVQFVRYEKAR